MTCLICAGIDELDVNDKFGKNLTNTVCGRSRFTLRLLKKPDNVHQDCSDSQEGGLLFEYNEDSRPYIMVFTIKFSYYKQNVQKAFRFVKMHFLKHFDHIVKTRYNAETVNLNCFDSHFWVYSVPTQFMDMIRGINRVRAAEWGSNIVQEIATVIEDERLNVRLLRCAEDYQQSICVQIKGLERSKKAEEVLSLYNKGLLTPKTFHEVACQQFEPLKLTELARTVIVKANVDYSCMPQPLVDYIKLGFESHLWELFYRPMFAAVPCCKPIPRWKSDL